MSPALKPEPIVILGTKVLIQSQNIKDPLRTSEAPGTSQSLRTSAPQDPREAGLNAEVVSEFESKVKVKSEKQPQDCPTHKPLVADNWASHVPQCHHQRARTGFGTAFWVLCGPVAAQRSSLGQQDPRFSKFQNFWKKQGNMIGPIPKRKGCRQPNTGEYNQGVEKLGTFSSQKYEPLCPGQGTLLGSILVYWYTALWPVRTRPHSRR